jgi:hemerythrin superfamily protein
MAARRKTKTSSKSRPAKSSSTQRRPRAGSRTAARRRKPASIGALAVEQMVPVDAILLLDLDHREVEGFFERFEQTEDDAEKEELARKICLALTVHAEIEESIFYPAARELIEDEDLLDEALVEHQSAKTLIAEILEMEPGEPLFDAKVTVLGEYVRHHIAEERDELFPKVRAKVAEGGGELDLYELGAELAQAKIDMLDAAPSE